MPPMAIAPAATVDAARPRSAESVLPSAFREPTPEPTAGAAREVVDRLRRHDRMGPTLVHVERIPATPARWAPVPDFLHADTRRLLTARGRERLYSHQAQALVLAHTGRDVLVTTPTASGKSLCYQVPMIDHLVRNPRAVAIYIAPTKALARDQWAELRRMAELLPAGSHLQPDQIVAYDGDTPKAERRELRHRARILVTNPDMLHHAILPNHRKGWNHFLPNLSHVVVDEIHSFRGMFGGHVGNVMRRLNRLHGQLVGPDRPPIRFMGASATLANEHELARLLLDRNVTVIGQSGAPTTTRHVLFIDPAAEQTAGHYRSAAAHRVASPYEQLIRDTGLQQMLFCRTRRTVEWTVDALRKRAGSRGLTQPQAETRIRGYRGGYTADERRAIEGDLRNGTIRTVVSSNALEMGIDVGSVGCVMSLGYPGTVASTWQQWGRAGRTGEGGDESMAVFLASGDPLDQYIVRNPDFILNREAEHAHLHPEHPTLLQRHLPCVLFESDDLRILPPSGDALPRTFAIWDALQELIVENKVEETFPGEGLYRFSGRFQDLQFSLRNIGGSTRILLDEPQTYDRDPQELGTIEQTQTDSMVHEGAVYVHDGARYRVQRVDRRRGLAYVLPDPDGRQLTEPVKTGNVSVLDELARSQRGQAGVCHGRVRVNSLVDGYRVYEEKARGRLEMQPDIVPLHDTEPVVYRTSAYWLEIPDSVRRALDVEGLWVPEESAQALGQLLYRLAPLHLMCDPGDLDLHVREGGDGQPVVIYIHETCAEGLGLGATLHDVHDSLLSQALTALFNCRCEDGCPACVGPGTAARIAGQADRKHLVTALLASLQAQPEPA